MLIINADDFGMSYEVNEAIIKLFDIGLLDRCSIMVNMPLAKDTVQGINGNSIGNHIGLHINLTEGKPITEKLKKTFFCCQDGNLTLDNVNLKNRLLLSKYEKEAIAFEVSAQMQKYKELGFSLQHADSHNYSSADFSVSKIIIQQAMKNNFTSLRLAKNIRSYENDGMKYIYRKIVNCSINRFNNRFNSSESTDYFCSVHDLSYALKTNDWSDRRVELMVHPYLDKNGDIIDHYTLEKLIDPLRELSHKMKRDITHIG